MESKNIILERHIKAEPGTLAFKIKEYRAVIRIYEKAMKTYIPHLCGWSVKARAQRKLADHYNGLNELIAQAGYGVISIIKESKMNRM